MRVFLILCLVVVAGCSDRSFTPTRPDALDVGTAQRVYVGTTRAREADGHYASRRSPRTDLLALTVSVPPDRQPGQLKFGYAHPDPKTEFSMAGRSGFASEANFLTAIRRDLARKPAGNRDITVFVHGYNATQAETAFRAAQMANDLEIPGIQAVYSWPSRGRATGYAYDTDSMLFARDGLEGFLTLLRKARPDHIVIIAHSMGAVLTMETLRQADIRQPGWSAKAVDGVMLLSPDLDVEVFRSQMMDLSPPPSPIIIAISETDPVLTLSGLLRGSQNRERLGNISSIDKVADLPVTILDLTDFTKDSWSRHLTAATSPALIAIFNRAAAAARTMGSDRFVIDTLLPGAVIHKRRATEIRISQK